MTSFAKKRLWFINNIGRKMKSILLCIAKCYKNALPRITLVWNVKHTTQNCILKCVNHLYDTTQVIVTIQTLEFSD